MRRDTLAVVVLVRGGAEVARWALAGRAPVDLSVVEELARLELAARRVGCSIRLRDARRELCELLDLVGLGGVLAGAPGLPREVGREAEGLEQLGVQEVVVPDDPVP